MTAAAELASAPTAAVAPTRVVFHSKRGRTLEVVCSLEEIISTHDAAPVATRVTPTLIDREKNEVLRPRVVAGLDPDDFWHVDLAVMRAAEPLLRQARLPTLAPVSVHSIGGPRTRDRLFREAGIDARLTKAAMIAELVGVGEGTPVARLGVAIPMIRPLACAVFVEALAPDAVGAIAFGGVAGVTIDFRFGQSSEQDLLSRMMQYGANGSAKLRNVVARGLPGDELFSHAQRWGITHASVRAARRASEAGTR